MGELVVDDVHPSAREPGTLLGGVPRQHDGPLVVRLTEETLGS